MSKKRNLLKNMQLSSVDLCAQGCNPAANIKLTKSVEEGGEDQMEAQKWTETIVKAVKEALGIADAPELSPEEEMEHIAKAWQASAESIWNDTSLTAEERYTRLEKSREEMNDYIAKKTASWAGIEAESGEIEKEEEEDMAEKKPAKNEAVELDFDALSEEDQETVAAIFAKYTATEKAEDEPEDDAEKKAAEEAAEMEEAPSQPEVEENEAVKKALDEMAELRKSIEMRELVEIAKKYEPLGKKADETAEMLYELKKSSQKTYDDIVAVYDEALRMQEASGIFKEFGSNRTAYGSKELETTVAELRKSYPDKARTELVELAYRTNPNLSEY